MSRNDARWVTDKLTWLTLGAGGGMTIQKVIPYSEWTCPIALFIFMCSMYINATLRGEQES